MTQSVAQKLKSIETWIFDSVGGSDEEWLDAEKRLDDLIRNEQLTQEELLPFVQSGAGEMLLMTCSAIRSEREKAKKR